MSIHHLPVGPGGLNLAATLGCGQVFRWSAAGNGAWEGIVGSHPVRAWVAEEHLVCDTDLARAQVARYFRLDDDLCTITASFPPDPELLEAMRWYRGMRLIRQDPWECLISFLCAQNANIPRIRGMIESLCAAFGAPLGGGRHGLPAPADLAVASEVDLFDLRLGYRGPWVLDAARAVASGRADLEAMRRLDTPALLAALRGLSGVGPKVAACIALFAYDRLDVVPIDVWINRAISARCPDLESARSRAEYAQRWLGPYAGYAQQYLFHYQRALAGVPCEGRILDNRAATEQPGASAQG